MRLETLILYPDQAREVAEHTQRRLADRNDDGSYERPAMLPDGTFVMRRARPVDIPTLGGDSDAPGPRMRPRLPDPLRWVSHAAEVAAQIMGHALLRRDGWTAEDLATAGLGLLLRDQDGGWSEYRRGGIRRALLDPRRTDQEISALLTYAARTGFWYLYSDTDD